MKIFGIEISSTGLDAPGLVKLREKYARRITATGHRKLPEKPGEFRVVQDCMNLAAEQALWGVEGEDTIVYTGMALGWDLAVARACDKLGIPYVAILPCPNQALKWNPQEQNAYASFLSKAVLVHSLYPQSQHGYYYLNALRERNTVLINQATEILALHDGRPAGGTTDALAKAAKKGLPVANAWKHYEEL